MIRFVFVRTQAKRDLKGARDWYEEIQPGLGDRLTLDAERALRILTTEAHSFSLYHKGFRRIRLTHFPYRFFFKIVDDYVVVFRLLHEKRDHPRHLRD